MPELSRIIVKNLPKYVTQDRLRDHFSKKGTITDIKLVKTATGVFRRFAYIGFQSEKEARATVKHFHNTFVDTLKVQVELARPVGDPNLPRAWSKHTKAATPAKDQSQPPSSSTAVGASSSHSASGSDERQQADAKKSFIDSLYEEEQKRESLATYLQVLKPRAAKATWQNDDGVQGDPKLVVPGTAGKKSNAVAQGGKSADKGSAVEPKFDKFGNVDSDEDEYQSIPAGGFAKLDESGSDAELDDDEDVGNSTKVDAGADSGSASGSESGDNVEPSPFHDEYDEQGDRDRMDVEKPTIAYPILTPKAPTTRPPAPTIATSSKDQLVSVFKQFGAISAVHIPINRDTKQPKGIAFVTFATPADALVAYKQMQGQFFMGRMLHLRGAKAAKDAIAAEAAATDEIGNGSFKARQLAQRKATAGKDFNWNSLFMAGDAVASAMAARLGVAKSDILDRESEDMAVRLALAETHVIGETKEYLAEHGVVLDAFERKLRSDCVVLIKNVTYGTTLEEVVALVEPFGELGRVLFPPAGTLAVVEFLVAADAKAAFRSLAYKRFKNLPLYLEWAPKDCFDVAYDPNKHAAGTFGAITASSTESGAAAVAAISGHSKKRMRSAAFMGEDDIDETKLASTQSVSASSATAAAAGDTNTKLIVRNVPFEATIKDLRQLFRPFAHVKSVRLPKKVTGGHRGFAFAEFLTHGEAIEAIRALRHTHLYGRRLVIEFANQQESVEELREKTKKMAAGAKGSKRARVDMGSYKEREGEDDASESEDE
ncbi:hypothetical protein BCR44DRAFT_1487118 [Catenaria anguillulae PL171]|uniref:RRM domain-containing protein n=1 Tax=Catenaria anguillulae PL171 TaxID=765915 RepID=A0A1Y2HD51_9FUNG|nr:hypothetical protein BCR44DRAFT_1487118 [Catenaria anguillulae PL171]